MSDLRVGDEVRVHFNSRRGGDDPGEVVKVGHKLVTIRVNGRDEQFRLDDQRWTGRQVGAGTYFRTLEQVAASEREASVRGVLDDAGVELNRRCKFTPAQIEALAELVKTFGQGGASGGRA